MRVRVVVADQSEVRFYDVEQRGEGLRLSGRLADPQAHLHDRDFKSDRPGRVFDHAPGAGRRGATAHHGTGGERRPRRHEAEVFAREIAARIETAHRRDEFDRLILMAAPGFLGVLREALPASVKATVAAEVGKDLVHQDAAAVEAHLPADAFQTVAHE
ncbi:MAG TPA: host attachment protein [Steroidobacteraceae bacterium]|nr:host attachment protein [Steroidobacteraceae bacterium]